MLYVSNNTLSLINFINISQLGVSKTCS